MKCLFLTLFLLWTSFLTIYAQNYQFKNYKVENGLTSNDTYAILQDSKNRIWVSTTGGVSCFNGKTFKNYTTDDGLASNTSFSIFEDSKGRIWIGTLGKGISTIYNEKITNISSTNFTALGSANSFLEAKDGTIYIIFSNGIGSYKNGTWKKLDVKVENYPRASFHQAAWFDDNTIIIASVSDGVFKLSLDSLKLENIYSEEDGINNICYSILVEDNKTIWIGAYGGLYKIVDNEITAYEFNPDEFDKNRVYDILEKSDSEFYLTFEGNGFGVFNKKTGKLELLTENNGLPTNYIYHIIKDTEGNIWMTSYGEGIIRFRDKAFKIYNQNHGLNSVNALEPWNDKLLVATNKGLVTVSEEDEIEPIGNNTKVNHIFIKPNDDFLYSTDKAVFEYSQSAKKSKLIDAGDYNLLYSDKKNTLLFQTEAIRVIAPDSSYYINSRRSIAVEPIGDRYILCKISGLFQLKNQKLDTIAGLNPREHNDFKSLAVINKNEVIAANDKNLYHLTLQNDNFKLKTIDMSCFPALKQLRALTVHKNDLWLAGRGIFVKVDLRQLIYDDKIVVENYCTIPHFLENDIDYNSLRIVNNETVAASSLSGMVVFHPNDFLPNPKPPKLNLSQVLLFSEPFNDSIYRQKSGIVLPYQKNYLSFSMEAITFTNPENVQYKYRMKGLRDGDEWSKPTTESEVVFSYLPPNNYTFEFMADNGDGVWQTVPYTYAFKIEVPFWKTWMFWAVVITTVVMGGFTIYYLRNEANKKRNELYTQNLIKAQEQERTRVARELHDSVGQKLMLLTKQTKNTGTIEMESLASNTLQELRAISRGLHPATLERLGPTTAIKTMIDEIDANTEIFFTHQIDDIDALISKEASLHLYRIIQEVLNNMIKHSEAKAASVTIEQKSKKIKVKVEDNGVGFEFQDKLRTGESLGMKTLLERTKILHSKIDIKSEINRGTKITLIIPIYNV
ncbi:MAG: hypothetical protein CL526_04040 [Aequorivita sp.]|nr:hypothetical protein [Aequorivita sp.]|tara:strand:- start:90368 stop:93238 length:2871 start_codon:yes stop_codon:yes gene_type:complete